MADHPSNRPAQNLGEIFSYHPPRGDQSAALRCVREAVMWANASIALEAGKGSGE